MDRKNKTKNLKTWKLDTALGLIILCCLFVITTSAMNSYVNNEKQNTVKNYFLANEGNTIIVFEHVSMVYHSRIWLNGSAEYILLDKDKEKFHIEFKKWLDLKVTK